MIETLTNTMNVYYIKKSESTFRRFEKRFEKIEERTERIENMLHTLITTNANNANANATGNTTNPNANNTSAANSNANTNNNSNNNSELDVVVDTALAAEEEQVVEKATGGRAGQPASTTTIPTNATINDVLHKREVADYYQAEFPDFYQALKQSAAKSRKKK